MKNFAFTEMQNSSFFVYFIRPKDSYAGNIQRPENRLTRCLALILYRLHFPCYNERAQSQGGYLLG